MILSTEIVPSTLQAPLVVGLLLGALAMLLPLFFACYAFARQFATRGDLAETKKDMADVEKRFADDLQQVEARITATLSGNRENTEHRFGEIIGKMDALNSTMQLFVNDNTRTVSLLEGKFSVMETIAAEERKAARG
jgi:hypothetical protein